MKSKKYLTKFLFSLFILSLFAVSAFSSIYAMETEDVENITMDTEFSDETISGELKEIIPEDIPETAMEDVVLKLHIIGEGDIRICNASGETANFTKDKDEKQTQLTYKRGSEVNIEAAVKDESDFIYGFYVKAGDGSINKEQILGKGYVHNACITLDEDTQILVVFAKIDEKEIVFENPLEDMPAHEIQTKRLGDIGQNWGMYNLYTEYTIIPEFGSNASYAYGHIIQADTNHDLIYDDVTYTSYCIEYGVECPAGGFLTEDELSVNQRESIGTVLAYGWRQPDTQFVEEVYYDLNARAEYAVTQGIIWCYIDDIFDTPAGESAMTAIINATHKPEHARNYYEMLKHTICNINTKPSFDGKTLTLEWNEKTKRYETQITDTNGMLEYFDYVYPGITFEKKGNTLTIYTKDEYFKPIGINAKRKVYGGADSVKTWNGWNGKQDMVTYTDNSRDVSSLIRIRTKLKNGSMELLKTSQRPEITNDNTYYSLENAVYGIYSDEKCTQQIDTMTTDKFGRSNTVSLKEGTYYIQEISASKGYLLDPEIYKATVYAGKETQVEVREIPMEGQIRLTKTIHSEDINFDNGNPMFIFKLIGEFPNGSKRVLYQIVDFTKEYVALNTDELGDVHLTITFDELTAGTYVAHELETSRYTLENISNISNGRVDDSSVIFVLDTENQMEGMAEFTNDNYEQQNYSDSAKVINEMNLQYIS